MTHSITPPPELVQEWIGDYYGCPVSGKLAGVEIAIATRAAQWGANQELEACCEWLNYFGYSALAKEFRAARRPKPMSLKEQALSDLTRAYNADKIDDTTFENLRRALEQLDD